MSKKIVMLLVTAAFWATARAETYYLDPTVNYSVSPYPNALTNGYYWTTERDGSGTRSSDTIKPLSPTDHYVIANGTATNKAAWVRHGGTVTSTGGYIHIGDDTTEPWTAGALVLQATGSSKTFNQNYTNYLNRGEISFLGAYSRTTKLATSVVRSTKEDPFHLAFGASSCVVTWSGLIRGDQSACLVIGGKSDLCPKTSSYSGNSVYLSGKNYDYLGTVIVTNENRSIPSFSTRPVGFKLRYNLPATLVLCDYTSFTFYNTSTQISVRDLELGDQVLLNFPMSDSATSLLTVTNTFKMAADAKVQVLANMSTVPTKDRTVTVLTVPGVDALSLDKFELVGEEVARGFTLSIKNDTKKKTCSLQVNIKKLSALDEGYVVASKSDTTGSGNSTTYASIVTNKSAWTDAAVVGPEKDYYVCGFGATVFALRTPQKAWTDGAGNTGDDFTFPGKSLTIGWNGQLLAVGTKTRFNDVRLLDGSVVGNPNTEKTPVHTICGTMTVEPGCSTSVRVYTNKVQRLEVAFKGAGRVKFDGWSVKGKSEIFLDGDNSDFKGTMLLTNAYSSASTSYYQTLYVDHDEELGGALDTYDPQAFLLTRYSYLIISNSVTMAQNRGLTMYGSARLYVRNGTFSLDGLNLAGAQYLAGNIRVKNLTSSGSSTLYIPENTTLTLVREKPVANDRGLDLSGNKTLTITSGKDLAFASEIVQPITAPRVITNAVVTAKGTTFVDTVRKCFGTAAERTSPIAGYDVTAVVETKNADSSVTFKEILKRNYTPGTMLLVGAE